jgi:DNA polymerase IV (archaeal DinB-like DNA polymerase)
MEHSPVERIIGHLDMDAFFASIEERDNPRFKGRPLVVGADPEGGRGRGVVSTANYKAREYGIRSALPISTAWAYAEAARRAGKPEVVFMGGNMEKYAAVSAKVVTVVRAFVSVVEQASVDEVYMDLTTAGSFGVAADLVRKIKAEIKTKERLTCSVGVGPNKLVAKIASDMHKPDGLTVVKPEDVERVFDPLPVRAIPGIGPKTEEALRAQGVRFVRDLKKFSREELMERFGKWGGDMYEKARGVDETPVGEFHETKSIGEQDTFPEDTRDSGFIFARFDVLARGVFESFASSGFKTYKTLVVTVRFGDFETKTRSHTLLAPASDLATLRFEGIRMLAPFLDKRENPGTKKIRLIGVRLEKLF